MTEDSFPQNKEYQRLRRKIESAKSSKHMWQERLLEDEGDKQAHDMVSHYQKKIDQLKPRIYKLAKARHVWKAERGLRLLAERPLA